MVDVVASNSLRSEVIGCGVLQEWHFYKSLQQTILSRSFVEYACYSSAARRLLLFLANSQVRRHMVR